MIFEVTSNLNHSINLWFYYLSLQNSASQDIVFMCGHFCTIFSSALPFICVWVSNSWWWILRQHRDFSATQCLPQGFIVMSKALQPLLLTMLAMCLNMHHCIFVSFLSQTGVWPKPSLSYRLPLSSNTLHKICNVQRAGFLISHSSFTAALFLLKQWNKIMHGNCAENVLNGRSKKNAWHAQTSN